MILFVVWKCLECEVECCEFACVLCGVCVCKFIAKDVWTYLLQDGSKSPWETNNRDLLTLYQNANSSECPLVVDTSTPSCGNSRFGCWVCTVVNEDTSLKNTIENGEEWMEPLLELREELKETQDPAK